MKKSTIPISHFVTTKIKSIQANDTLKNAAKIMYENHLPSLLVYENDKIVGIVTHRDISLAITVYEYALDSQIKKIMTSPVVSVSSDTSILEAVDKMLGKRIHKLVVIDDKNVSGIISSTDLMVILSMVKEEQLHEILRGQLSK